MQLLVHLKNLLFNTKSLFRNISPVCFCNHLLICPLWHLSLLFIKSTFPLLTHEGPLFAALKMLVLIAACECYYFSAGFFGWVCSLPQRAACQSSSTLNQNLKVLCKFPQLPVFSLLYFSLSLPFLPAVFIVSHVSPPTKPYDVLFKWLKTLMAPSCVLLISTPKWCYYNMESQCQG